MERSFSTAEVAKILGKTPRFVIDWTERKLFHADIQPASGPGSRRLFSYPSVLAAGLVLALKEKFDLPRRLVAGVAEWVRQENYVWNWHSDEALKNYDADTLRRLDEEHKKKILADLEEAMNGTFIYTFGGNRHSMCFSPKKMAELEKGEGFHIGADYEAMICIDLSHIKALVDKGIEQLST
ncbi:MAG: hypothetical protein WCF59_08960 [Desulfobaccales bacterium]